MRTSLATHVLASVFTLFLAGPAFADDPQRWIPDHCLDHGAAFDAVRSRDVADLESLWNATYQRGFAALQRGELDVAESEMCQALFAARGFEPRDWRFAETLDELGLIAFELRDFDTAERVQGAAIAEMLLAVGPHGEPIQGDDASTNAVIRPDCRSGIAVYTERLGWIHERVPARIATNELRDEPWRVFGAGYLPLDQNLARRLGWLISQYLLQENMAAAAALGELQGECRGTSDRDANR